MRALLISEKPSLMREVQAVYKKINFKDQVDFTALHGHVVGLNEPAFYDKKWEKWTKESLPIVIEEFSYHPLEEEKELVEGIKEMIEDNDYDYLINCCDPEREGQNIFYSLYNYLGLDLPVKRLWVNDLNEPALKSAWNNLRDDQNDPFLKNLTTQALCRSYSDWLVGMNLSPALSLKYKRLLAAGRVMSVVEMMLAERELAIRNFKPSSTYLVEANFKEGYSGQYDNEGRMFKTKEEAETFISSLSKKGKVKEVEVAQTKENPPLLFSLGELQSEANKVYGYTLQETLNIAQNLYEMKILSYPRTDCTYIPDGDASRMPKILEAMLVIPEVNQFISGISRERVENYSKSRYVNNKKVVAHGAIILTGADFSFTSLNKAQRNIVTLVAKRILATLMDPIVFEKTKVITDIDGYDFITRGSVCVDKGYSVLYDRQFTDVKIKGLKEEQDVVVNKYDVNEKQATCPARYNDSTLIKAMMNAGSLLEDKEMAEYLKGDTPDQSGIGTPATRAAIVEKLLKPISSGNGTKMIIVERKGKSFHMTEDGLMIAKLIKPFKFSSPLFTAEWEKKFEEIQNGSLSMEEYMTDINKFIDEEIKEIFASNQEAHFTTGKMYVENAKCPLCGNRIKNTGKYYVCEKYGKSDDRCKFVLSTILPGGEKLPEKEVVKLCNGEPTKFLKITNKKGDTFNVPLIYNKEKRHIEFDFKTKSLGEPQGIKCSCGGQVYRKEGKFGPYFECTSCNRKLSEKIAGHKIKKTELERLYTDKVTGKIKGFINKEGKRFSGYLQFDLETKKVKFIFDEKKEK